VLLSETGNTKDVGPIFIRL